MTRANYAAYVARVEAFLDRRGIYTFSPDVSEDASHDDFSWRRCDCCGTTLGGDRSNCTAFHERTGEIVEVYACSDCVYFVAYGQLDDMTMLSIEEAAQ